MKIMTKRLVSVRYSSSVNTLLFKQIHTYTRPTILPLIEDFKRCNFPDPEKLHKIQLKAQEAYSKSLNYQKDTLWMINSYSNKPNALEDGIDLYKELIMKKGDGRNEVIYGEIKPKLQQNLAELLGCKRPKDIVLSTNATTLITQIISHYWGKPLKILSTTDEFYGTQRLLSRLMEINNESIEVDLISTEPFENFSQKVLEESNKKRYDIVILSHSFFKSANVLDDLDSLVMKLKDKVDKIVIDGSGAFGNISVKESMGSVMDHIYYIGGIYKYIGSGEGLSFMSLPKNCKDRPVFTGWLWGNYSNENQYYSRPLLYADDADRYGNSTVELSIWVRTNCILEYFKKIGLSIEDKNSYTRCLQDYMVKKIDESGISFISKKNLISKFGKWRPTQTCFQFKDSEVNFKNKHLSKEIVKRLEDYKIFADYRGDILRLCPAVYHTIFDMDILVKKLKEIDKNGKL